MSLWRLLERRLRLKIIIYLHVKGTKISVSSVLQIFIRVHELWAVGNSFSTYCRYNIPTVCTECTGWQYMNSMISVEWDTYKPSIITTKKYKMCLSRKYCRLTVFVYSMNLVDLKTPAVFAYLYLSVFLDWSTLRDSNSDHVHASNSQRESATILHFNRYILACVDFQKILLHYSTVISKSGKKSWC